jgi:hypothetical protein
MCKCICSQYNFSLELDGGKWSMQIVGSKVAFLFQGQNSFSIEWLFLAVNP